MDDVSSDILGQSTLPVTRGSDTPSRSSSFVYQLSFLVLLVGFCLYKVLKNKLDTHYELNKKLAQRRRHGIPDHDHRPFNLAYADIVTAREAAAAKQPRHPPQLNDRNAQPTQNIRHRQKKNEVNRASSYLVDIPGAFNFSPGDGTNTQSSTHSYQLGTDHNSRLSGQEHTANFNINPQDAGPPHRFRQSELHQSTESDGKKRVFDGQNSDEVEPTKKTRVEGHELIDGDEDAEWQNQENAKRGAKRNFGDEDLYSNIQIRRPKGKKARQFSAEKVSLAAGEDMDIDNEEDDEVPELGDNLRGKKRDRAEAGSTFGGDDDESSENEDVKLLRRRRKRRTVSKRKSDAGSSIGKKRDRDLVDVDENMEIDVTGFVSRKKRDKRASLAGRGDDDQRSAREISPDESLTSVQSRARQIGDEWESNGVKYKIGLNGQRLRQELVRKERQKFVMPKDSQHPDRDANLQVFVETWLTEEEFQEAKAQKRLAWQDSPKPPIELDTKLEELKKVDIPSWRVGKNLLWGSTNTTPSVSPSDSPIETPIRRPKQGRHSIATNVGLNVNPFQLGPAPAMRRIVSSTRPFDMGSPGGLLDSTNSSPRGPRKSLSKWERQDIEAEGITKIRMANEKKQAEKDSKLKAEREKAEQERLEKEKQERAKASAAVPTITLTAPAPDPQPAPSKTFTFAPPPTAHLHKNDAPATSKAAPTSSSSAPFPSFSIPTQAAPAPAALQSLSQPAPPPAQPFAFSKTAGETVAPAPAPAPPTPNSLPGFSLPKPPSAMTSQTNTAPANNSSSTATTSKPLFSFAPQPTQQHQQQAQANSESRGGAQIGQGWGSSITSRPGVQPGAEQQKPDGGQPQLAAAFNFSKPSGLFGGKSSQAAPTQQQSPTPQAGMENAPPADKGPIKFNFGSSNKLSTPAPAASGGSLSLTSAPGDPAKSGQQQQVSTSPFKVPAVPGKDANSNEGKSASSVFGSTGPSTFLFGKPTPSVSPQSNDASIKTSIGGFGTNATNSPFGNTTTFGNAQPTQASTSAQFTGEPSKTFGGFGSTGTSSSPFGNVQGSSSITSTETKPTAEIPKSTFGGFGGTSTFGTVTNAPSSSTPSFGTPTAFGGNSNTNNATNFGTMSPAFSNSQTSPFRNSNTFGGGASDTAAESNKATLPAKPIFSFKPSSTPNTDTSKSVFSNTNQASSASTTTTPSAVPPKYSFSFGQTGSSTNTTAPQSLSFGAGAPTEASFTFGNKNTGPTAFGFSEPSSNNANQANSDSHMNANGSNSSPFAFGSAPSDQQQS